mmetsp:Transcript_19307/g.35571  ORF Transcript_19307/g.35571 Transcript_19307/m.35571 type:complete len:181 (+) Transcript_19307:3677-4219(+)
MEDFGPWLISSQDSPQRLGPSRSVCVSFKERPPKPMKQVHIPIRKLKSPVSTSAQSFSKNLTPHPPETDKERTQLSKDNSFKPQKSKVSFSPSCIRHPTPLRMSKAIIAHRRIMSRSVSHIRKVSGSAFNPMIELHKIITHSMHEASDQRKKDEAKKSAARFRLIRSKPTHFRVVGIKQL